MNFDIAIVGGGASGLFASLSAKAQAPTLSVALIEKLPRVGKKLLATGNGRCNLTNQNAAALENYHGSSPFISSVLSSFGLDETLEFFHRLGIVTCQENGKLYPMSLQAGSVVDALRFEAERLAVQTLCDTEITAICPNGTTFELKTGSSRFTASAVIIATGGRASPSLGSRGEGYGLLGDLGHRITPVYPALTQLKTEPQDVKGLAGIKLDAVLTLSDGSAYHNEILFADYGLSGPTALSASRRVAELGGDSSALDLLPLMPHNVLVDELHFRVTAHPERSMEDFFIGLLHKRLGLAVLRKTSLTPTHKAGQLSAIEVETLASICKRYSVAITGTKGFEEAQVTCGGAVTSQFSSETLMSKKIPNLFCCGELLDVDGDCGGFNLQWAWSSGFVAGRHAALAALTKILHMRENN